MAYDPLGPSPDAATEPPTPLFQPGGPAYTFTLRCAACAGAVTVTTSEQRVDWACPECGDAYYTMLRIGDDGYLIAQADW